MKKIIIFDMDGTIVNTKQDMVTSINFVRSKKSLPPLSEDIIVNSINNLPIKELSKVFYDTDTFLKEDRNLFENHYINQCIKNSFLFDGMYKTLETLKNDNFNLSVATNAQTKFAEKILSCQKIDHFFDFIIGACKVDKPKPEPDMLNLILNLYNYDDKNDYTPIMVGDTHTDIEAGKNAGLKTVFVKWGFGTAIGNEDIVLKEPIELSKIKYLLNYL